MPNFKSLFDAQGKKPNELRAKLKELDSRVDAALVSKIINYICLPIPEHAKAICDYFGCEITELYDPHELLQISQFEKPRPPKPKKRKTNEFNLNVRVERDLVERIFSPENMRRLGLVDKSSAIRSYLFQLDSKLARIIEKEKTSGKRSN